MRKIDYQTLAALIREQVITGKENMAVGAGSQWARGDELVTRATLLAREFAEKTSVDRAAFLKACGIE